MAVRTALRSSTAEQRGLLAAAQAGDERAFRELVEPHRRALEVHAYRMLGSPTTPRTSSRRR